MRLFLTAGVLMGLLDVLPAVPVGSPAREVTALTDMQLASGLASLGKVLAPDLPQTASWAKVRFNGREVGLLLLSGEGANVTGNGFVVREKAGVEAEVWLPVYGATLKVGTKPTETSPDDFEEVPSRMITGDWKPGDLAHDVEEVSVLLRKYIDRAKAAPASDEQSGFGQPQFLGYANANDPASVLQTARQSALIWACALQRTGHAQEALKIGRLALEGLAEADRKRMLDTISGGVANSLWQRSMQEFFRHHDWKLLVEDLRRLTVRFTQGWMQRDAARVLLRQLEARAGLPEKPPLKLSAPLSPEDQQLLTAWLSPPKDAKAAMMMMMGRWSLLPPLASDIEGGEPPEPQRQAAPAVFPESKGIAAIPLLAALLSDDTFVEFSPLGGYGGAYGRRFFSSPDAESAEDRLKAAYSQMPKPPTRAELAWGKLQQVLPSQLQQHGNNDLAEASGDILQWYASIKDAAPGELAVTYLEGGDRDPNIIANVARLKDEKKVAQAEDALINTAQVYSLESLEPYVRQRGEKAAGFIKKLRQKLEDDLAKYEGGEDNQKKMLERGLKRLEAKASGETKARSLDELFAALAKASGDGGAGFSDDGEDAEARTEALEAWRELPAVLAKLKTEERLLTVLTHLPSLHSGNAAVQFYGMLFDKRPSRDGSSGKTPVLWIELPPEQRKQMLAQTRELWNQMLNAQLPDLEDEDARVQFVWSTQIGVESLATGKTYSEIARSMTEIAALGPRLEPLLRDRAQALLDGRETAPLPEGKSVPADEVKKLVAELGALEPLELGRRLDEIPAAQYLALNALVAADEHLPANFDKLAGMIRKVKFVGVKEDEAWKAWQGRVVDLAAFTALVRQASAMQERGTVALSLAYQSSFTGWTLNLRKLEKGRSNYLQQVVRNVSSGLEKEDKLSFAKHCRRINSGWFQAAAASAQWSWLDAPNVPSENSDKPAETKSELPEALAQMASEEPAAWQQLKNFFADMKPPLRQPAAFYIFTMDSQTADEELTALRPKG